MVDVSSGLKIHWKELEERFPQIAFLLGISTFPSLKINSQQGRLNAEGAFGPLYSNDIEGELVKWMGSLPLNRVDILYVFGVGLGYHYEKISSWLHEKKERVLIFFEHDLSVLAALFSSPLGKRILEDKQVHIVYLQDLKEETWDETFDESVGKWVSDLVELTGIASYEAVSLTEKRLALLRKSTIVHAGIGELVHYHKLMDNIASNFLEIEGASHVNQWKGAFEGVPAVLCGAGSSLFSAKEALGKLEQQALIFAGGSTITALSHYGIHPHISMAVDPNEEEYDRLKGSSCFEEPFIFSSRLRKEVLTSSNVQKGYLCSDTGGVFESWMHSELGIDPQSIGPELGMEALSVTTLAIPFARFLGCSPILFCGVDLSYKERTRYAPGVLPDSEIPLKQMEEEKRSMEKLLHRENAKGEKIETLVKWVMEGNCIEEYIKTQEKGQFFNSSDEGLPIEGAPYLPIEQFAHTYCRSSYDLRGRLHAEGQGTRLDISKEQVKGAFARLSGSLQKGIALMEEMLQEIEKRFSVVDILNAPLATGKMSVIEMDLEEEPAFLAALQCSFPACSKLLERCYPEADSNGGEEERRAFLEKKQKLFERALETARSTLEVISYYAHKS